MKRYAVIPSNGRDCINDCIDAIGPQVDHIIVIDTDKAWHTVAEGPGITRLPCSIKGNISHWWNEGLERAQVTAFHAGAYEWDVAVLNDDAIVSPHWMANVGAFMREQGAAAGCGGPMNNVLTSPEAVPLDHRMVGYAFVLRGEEGLRANEKIKWYFSDDYLDWEARKAGGMAMWSGMGATVEHRYPNGQMTPELHAQVASDARTFMELYGRMPW